MTKLEALTDLLEKVEEENRTNFIDGFAANAFPPESGGGHCTFHDVVKAFDGSLDAAKALHEAVLPGWEWELRCDPETRASVVTLGNAAMDAVDSIGLIPARAWLVAILKALIAKEN